MSDTTMLTAEQVRQMSPGADRGQTGGKSMSVTKNFAEVIRKNLKADPKLAALVREEEEIPQELCDAYQEGHAAGIAEERERIAKIVEGWHIRKGGCTELSHAIRNPTGDVT